MKLQLKHLAPYLPYGLKCQYTHTKEVGQISNIYTIGGGYDNEDIKLSINFSEGEHIWMYKPILRPLSALTKEIEHNGEKFVPIEYFEIGDEVANNEEYDFGNIKLIKSLDSFSKNGFVNDVKYLPYGVVDILLSWHFDVFRLIEQGLAIDINTIK